MKTPDKHFIAHGELEWTIPLPIKRVVDPVVAQYIMQLREALTWALQELETHECYPTLDPDDQAAFDAAQALVAS